jgi:hypothetical protein
MIAVRIPALLICLCSITYAQSTTGNLEGWILDVSGTPIVGAEVTVTSPDLQGMRGVSTDERGFFRLLALPSGKYTVKVRHLSYLPATVENVRVWLGKTTTVADLRLQQTSVQMAEVVVSGARGLLDPSSTTSGNNLARETFEVLPIERNYRSIASILPQANQSYLGDEVNIAGSTGLENVYIVDGMNISDPYWGGANTNLPYNFIKEIQVKTGGYEAEFGHALGGIMNVITHSGGNKIQGQVYGFLTDQALHSSPKLGVNDTKLDKSSQYDFGISIGGPIIQDQLWFFGAYNPTFDNRVSSFPGSGPLDDKSTRHLFAGKLTWQPGSSTNFMFTVLGDPSQRTSVGPGGFFGFPGAVANPDPVLGKLSQGGIAVSVRAHHMIGSDLLLTLSASRMDRKDNTEPLNILSSADGFTSLYDYVTGIASGGYGGLSENNTTRSAVQASATMLWNLHALKLGAEYEEDHLDSRVENSIVSRWADTVYSWFHYAGVANVLNRTAVLFFQDSWSISDRFRLNIGMRWEGQYFVNKAGVTVQSITDGFQPRLGFVYQIGEMGSQKLLGSAGRFYEQVPLASTGGWYGYWLQTFVNYPRNPLSNSRGGDTSNAATSNMVPRVPGLSGEYYDEFTLGYERIVMSQLKVGVRGVYRALRSAIEGGFSPIDNVYRMGNPGRGELSYLPKARREYSAFELTLEKTSDIGFSFLASYVLSRNFGNYTGLSATDLTSIGSNDGPQFDFVEQTVNSTGLLPNDKTHVVKFFGTYRFDFGISVGMGFLWQSGMPLNEYGTPLPGTAPYWSFIQTRGTAGRSPANRDLNFRLAYDLENLFRSNTRPRLLIDIFHVGNPQTPVTYDQVHYTDVDQNGNQINPNPNYGKVTHYQPPMSMRLGLEVGF